MVKSYIPRGCFCFQKQLIKGCNWHKTGSISSFSRHYKMHSFTVTHVGGLEEQKYYDELSWVDSSGFVCQLALMSKVLWMLLTEERDISHFKGVRDEVWHFLWHLSQQWQSQTHNTHTHAHTLRRKISSSRQHENREPNAKTTQRGKNEKSDPLEATTTFQRFLFIRFDLKNVIPDYLCADKWNCNVLIKGQQMRSTYFRFRKHEEC